MKIIKRRKSIIPVNITEKFKEGQNNKKKKQEEEKQKEEDDILIKLKKSKKIYPIIQEYYENDPIKSGTQEYWKYKSFPKSLTSVRKALLGTLFNNSEFIAYKDRQFTVDEILQSIANHKLALTPSYKPSDKSFLKIDLHQFLYNPYSKSIGRSYFLYWMNNTPIMDIPLIPDDYPKVTKEFIKLCDFDNLNIKEQNQIIKGIGVFMNRIRLIKISPIYRPTPELHAKIFHQILMNVFEVVNVQIMPHNLVSPKLESWIIKGLEDSPYII